MFYIDSPCVYSLLNYFPNNAATIKKLLYALVWTGILVLLELYTVKIEVLHYGKMESMVFL